MPLKFVISLLRKTVVRRQTKNNPLRNRHALLQLNPYAKVEKKRANNAQNKRIKAKAQQLAKQAEVSGLPNSCVRNI